MTILNNIMMTVGTMILVVMMYVASLAIPVGGVVLILKLMGVID